MYIVTTNWCDPPLQIVHLFLCPQLHQLSGVLLPVTTFEPVVLPDVSISVLELVERCLEYFHSHLLWDAAVLWPEWSGVVIIILI